MLQTKGKKQLPTKKPLFASGLANTGILGTNPP
jgi:hypothetical protein